MIVSRGVLDEGRWKGAAHDCGVKGGPGKCVIGVTHESLEGSALIGRGGSSEYLGDLINNPFECISILQIQKDLLHKFLILVVALKDASYGNLGIFNLV